MLFLIFIKYGIVNWFIIDIYLCNLLCYGEVIWGGGGVVYLFFNLVEKKCS